MPSQKVPKWKVVENVVTAIEHSLLTVPNAKVVPNASIPEKISGKSRQVDAYVEVPTGPRMLRIGIEVRDKSARLDIEEVEQLCTKLRKLDVDLGCIVSRSGFSQEAVEEATRQGIELRTIHQIEKSDWWLAPSMEVTLQEVTLLSAELFFSESDVAVAIEKLTGTDYGKLMLRIPNGAEISLYKVISDHGVQALSLPQLAGLKDQDVFPVKLRFPAALAEAQLIGHNGPLPLPIFIAAKYKLTLRTEIANFTDYESSHGVTAYTTVSHLYDKQFTFVAMPADDGTQTLAITMAQPRPAKSKIEKRSQALSNPAPKKRIEKRATKKTT
jgi:hypothetical protein